MPGKLKRDTWGSIIHKFCIYSAEKPVEGYIIAGVHKDGSLFRLELVLAKTGESIRGMARCWATAFSMCLESGVPLENLVKTFEYFRFEPSGMTDDKLVPTAHSIADYVCRWLRNTFLPPEETPPEN